MSNPAEDPLETSDADLIAYLDGELPPRKVREVEARLSEDPASRERLAVYKKTWELLDTLPKPEPSRAFTAKTIEKLEPLPATAAPYATALALAPGSQTTGMAIEPRPRRRTPWLTWLAAGVLGLAAGYGGRTLLHHYYPPAKPAADDREVNDQIVQDLRILHNLHLYRYVDDMDLANELATPEYFGDDRKD